MKSCNSSRNNLHAYSYGKRSLMDRMHSLAHFGGWWFSAMTLYASTGDACPFCGRPGCPVGLFGAGFIGVIGGFFMRFLRHNLADKSKDIRSNYPEEKNSSFPPLEMIMILYYHLLRCVRGRIQRSVRCVKVLITVSWLKVLSRIFYESRVVTYFSIIDGLLRLH